MTASYIGRRKNNNNNNDDEEDDMAAFSLASLSANLTCISILIGTLSASETLQPRAFSMKQYETVGILAWRGLMMCMVTLFVPVCVLMSSSSSSNNNNNNMMMSIYHILGQNDTVSHLSVEWIHMYIWSVPCMLLFRTLQRFLASQNIVFPCVVGAAISSMIIHPWLLKDCMNRYDFRGSALAIVGTQALQLIITVMYVWYNKSYVEGTLVWIFDKSHSSSSSSSNNSSSNSPSNDHKVIWKKVLDRKELWTYASLSFGGIFALSEWWYWESICFVAGRMGVIPLCVHSITYQIIPLIYMLPLGMSIGLSVRMGQLLPHNVEKAKTLAVYTMIVVIFLSLIVTFVMYYYQRWIISLFTSDEVIIEGCIRIWPKVCMYILGLYIFCINSGILRALGLQWRMGLTITIILWCFSLPFILYVCIHPTIDDGMDSLVTMWDIFFWSYIVLDIGLILCYTTADWNEIGRKAKLSMMLTDTTNTTLIRSSIGDSNYVGNSRRSVDDDLLSYDEEVEGLLTPVEETSVFSFDSRTYGSIGSIGYHSSRMYESGRSYVTAFMSSAGFGGDSSSVTPSSRNNDETPSS